MEGSNKCGRIDHLMVDGQTGADLERVKQLEGVLEHLYVEMQPGEKWFFCVFCLFGSWHILSKRIVVKAAFEILTEW